MGSSESRDNNRAACSSRRAEWLPYFHWRLFWAGAQQAERLPLVSFQLQPGEESSERRTAVFGNRSHSIEIKGASRCRSNFDGDAAVSGHTGRPVASASASRA